MSGHMSCVMCHMSCLMCHMFLFSLFFLDAHMELVGGGSVINGAYHV